ncbi:hypothetical protein WG899_03715 [Paucibacter sp. AS339]|uniref:hypothetical protein n=1 Tax=Paucibacter hankyongi TaxID=3133434 RepID=UPI0030A81533
MLSGSLSLLAWLGACSSTPVVMQAPAGFEGQSLTLAAANRSRATGLLVDESFDLGPYRVTGIEGKNSSSGGSFQIGGAKVENKRGGFSYRMVGGSSGRTEVSAQCSSKSHETSVPLFSAVTLQRYKANFACDCRTQDGHNSTLSIASDSGWQGAAGSNPVRLLITVDGTEYPLGRYDVNGRLVADDEPFYGYRLDGPSGPVAALGLSYPGTVWLHERLPAAKREAMSCALAGLMLHRGP